jgi:bacillithiol biosynthesis cysteine-adding enzyme BshC
MSLRFAPAPAGALQGDLAAAARAQQGRRFPAAAAGALLADSAAAAARDRLLAGGVLAVTTGQQAGLFTGPLYTMHKAVTAAALAQQLEARLGLPVVPVFWVAGDDHDFAEINHCAVIGQDGRLARITLRDRPADAPQRPAYAEPVGPEGAAALAQLEQALPPSDFRGETLAWLSRHYRADASMAEAFAQAMAAWLGPLGVVVCRGWDGALKGAAAGVLLGAARDAAALDTALAEEARALAAAGREAPVEVGNGLSLLMVEDAQGSRDRLRLDGPGRFAARRSGTPWDLDALARLLQDDPTRLSANVLLRPAVEAAILPTVAYVGGPAELRYLEQAAPVFALLGVPRPARVPRLSGTVLEAKVEKVMDKLGLTLDDLARADGDVAARVAREDLPPGAAAALDALRRAITDGFAALGAAAAAVDRTLEKPVENARNQALHGTHEVEKKLIAALKRSADTALQQLARARDAVAPGGAPQERVLTLASFEARHGAAVRALLAAAGAAHAQALLEAPGARP